MAITLGLVEAVDDNGVYVSMPGSRGVLRGPYEATTAVATGQRVLVAATDDGQNLIVGAVGDGDALNVKSFGAVGDGVTDDSAAIQSAIDAAAEVRGQVVVPGGVYVVDGTVNVTDVDDFTIVFGSDAWLQPSDGYALTVSSSERVRIHGMRVRFAGGTPDGALLVETSPRLTLTDPVVYLWDDDAGTPDGLVIGDNSYWCDIARPRLRKLSGTITNDLDDGIVFTDVANAGRVVGGDLSNCAVGVRVAGANSVYVAGTAFETLTTGIQVDDNSNNAALQVHNCRFESVDTAISVLNDDKTSLPILVGDCVYVGITTVLDNPNGLPVQIKDNASIHVVGSGYGFTSTGALIEITPFDQAGPAFRVNGRYPYVESSTFEISAQGWLSMGSSTRLGFYGGTPAVKQTVTGSRGGNAALASLLTALANIGLITDSSS